MHRLASQEVENRLVIVADGVVDQRTNRASPFEREQVAIGGGLKYAPGLPRRRHNELRRRPRHGCEASLGAGFVPDMLLATLFYPLHTDRAVADGTALTGPGGA